MDYCPNCGCEDVYTDECLECAGTGEIDPGDGREEAACPECGGVGWWYICEECGEEFES